MNDTDELRAAAQQALVALVHHTEQTRPIQRTADAIEALRAALAQPTAPDRWNEGFKHGQWLAKHSAPVVERADSAPPVVERVAGNVSDNAAPVAPAADAPHIADGYSARPYGDGYIIHHESGGAWAADLAMVAAVLEIARLRAMLATVIVGNVGIEPPRSGRLE